MRGFFLVLTVAFLVACGTREPSPNRLVFALNDSVQANFPIAISDSGWVVNNGGEAIQLDQVASDTYHVPVFNGTLTLASASAGFWTDSLRPETESGAYHVPFTLTNAASTNSSQAIAGCWDVWFGANNAEQAGTADAQLDLRSDNGQVEGTMRTPTGDYRYLAGHFDGEKLVLQTFDGAHLFYFGATFTNNQWTDGHFYSGNHYHTTWSAALAEPWESGVALAQLNPPADSLFVRLINAEGNSYNRTLVPTEGRVTVLDILGTWCPNCMDEVRLLTALPMEHADQLSVAFERPDSAAKAYELSLIHI